MGSRWPASAKTRCTIEIRSFGASIQPLEHVAIPEIHSSRRVSCERAAPLAELSIGFSDARIAIILRFGPKRIHFLDAKTGP